MQYNLAWQCKCGSSKYQRFKTWLTDKDANINVLVGQKVQKHNNQQIFSGPGEGYLLAVMNNTKVVTRNWIHREVLQLLSATVVLQLFITRNKFCRSELIQFSWDPGDLYSSGLEASRILSGGECHGLGLPNGSAMDWTAKWT